MLETQPLTSHAQDQTNTRLDTEFATQPTKQWLYENCKEWLHQRADKLNAFLAKHQLWPPFRPAEILVTNEMKAVLYSPDELLAYFFINSKGKPTVAHHAAIARHQITDQLATNHHHPEKPALAIGRSAFSLDREKTLVALPMNAGATELGKEPPAHLMCFVMKKADAGGAGMVVTGSQSEIEAAVSQNNHERKTQPIRLSASLMAKLNHHLDTVEELFQGKYVRLPETMAVADATESTVKGYEIFWESGKFYVTVALNLKDGSRTSFVLNRGELIKKQNGETELLESSTYFVTLRIRGALHVVNITMNRIQGKHQDYMGQNEEIPRGFAQVLRTVQEATEGLSIGAGETGISEQELKTHETHQTITTQDPTFENVNTVNHFVDLGEIVPELENKQQEMPAVAVEELTPGFTRMSDILHNISTGEVFNDSHSLSLIAHYCIKNHLTTLRPEMAQQHMLFEKTTDWRTGQTKLTILRTSSDTEALQAQAEILPGVLSPNTGNTRVWDNVYYHPNAQDITTLPGQAQKEIVGLSFTEILRLIEDCQLDILTVSVIFKYFLQKDILEIETEKL